MDLGLSGKLALVTGSSSGIGLEIAKSLLKENVRVIVCGRSMEKLSELKKSLSTEFPTGQIHLFAGDLAKKEDCSALIKEYPRVDILVNNMGIYEVKEFAQITDEDWLRFFDVNVMSGIRLTRHYLPLMKEENWGRVVFISSESALNPPGEMLHYAMTKTAQLSLSRGLAETCVGTNVTVNSVLPGPTLSPGVIDYLEEVKAVEGWSDEDVKKNYFDKYRPTSIIRRFIEPKEIGDIVAFVCSQEAAIMNGSAIRAEGGLVRNIS